MFTAMILICAGGIKDPNMCYTQVHEDYFSTHNECVVTIYDSIRTYPQLFEYYDDTLEMTWKVSDWNCVNWKAIKT